MSEAHTSRRLIVEIDKGIHGHWFRIKSMNGNILCHSEGYHNKADCVKAVERIVQCRHYKVKYV